MAAKSFFLDENKLEQALEKVFTQLQKQGCLIGADKKSLIADVMESLKAGHFDMGMKLNDEKGFTSALRVMLLTKQLQLEDPNFKLDPKKLFNPKLTPDEKKDLQKELEEVLKKYLTKLNEKQNEKEKKLSAEQIDQLAKDLAARLVNNPENLLKNKEAMSLMATILMLVNSEKNIPKLAKIMDGNPSKMDEKELAIRELYAGMKPGESGSEPILVQNQKGNLNGFINMTMGLFTSKSFMDEQNRADTDRPDYQGIEFENALENLSMGAPIDTPLEQQVAATLNPGTPQLTPGG